MSEHYQVDAIDQKILSYLVKNARMPFLEIARECGISGAAIHQRVKKMEDAGIIAGSLKMHVGKFFIATLAGNSIKYITLAFMAGMISSIPFIK